MVIAELTAKLFTDYVGGSWIAKVLRNGELVREVVFTWPEVCGGYSGFDTATGGVSPSCTGVVLNDTNQVAIAGWRSDVRKWCEPWYNEFGGYGQLEWNSQDVVNGTKVIYGTVHVCEKEGGNAADYIAMGELYDQDNFKYTIQSYRKGLVEIVASRVKTAAELAPIPGADVKTARSLGEPADLKQECGRPNEQNDSP